MVAKQDWQQEERKLYLRDIFFLVTVIVLSVLLAENYLIKENTNAVDRIFSYLLFFLPLGTLTFIAQLLYRNRRIRKTGNLRSSLRYRLNIAFLLIAIIPSIPIFLISSTNVEMVVSGLFNRNVTRAMRDARKVLAYYENRVIQDFSRELLAGGLSLPVRQPSLMLEKWLGRGLIDAKQDYFALLEEREGGAVIRYENRPFLTGKQILPFEDRGTGPIQSQVLRFGKRDFMLLKIPLQKKNEFLLLGRPLHPGQEKYLRRFEKMHLSLENEEFLGKDVPGSLRLGLALIYIFMICMAFVIALLLARQISNPIVSLAAASRAVAEGELDIRLEIQASGEIGIMIDSFNQMTSELRTLRSRLFQTQRLAAWQEVARRLAHEIKNPLTPIQLSADRMLRRLEHPEKGNLERVVKKGALTIREQVEALRTLVEEFANFARLPKPILKKMNIEELIPEAVGIFQTTQIRLETRLAGGLPEIPVDKTLFIGLLNNLIKNSIEAILSTEDFRQHPEKALVRVSTSFYQLGHRKFVCLMVEDSGPGIDEELRERIFEPYFSTKGELHGRGLGLALVQRAVLEHDATISVGHSELGGAIFTVLFRIREDQ